MYMFIYNYTYFIKENAFSYIIIMLNCTFLLQVTLKTKYHKVFRCYFQTYSLVYSSNPTSFASTKRKNSMYVKLACTVCFIIKTHRPVRRSCYLLLGLGEQGGWDLVGGDASHGEEGVFSVGLTS